MVWDAARSGFLPETCGLFSPSEWSGGGGMDGWMRRAGSREKGRPQSKLVAQRERSFGAQVGYDSAFMSGWLSCADGIK